MLCACMYVFRQRPIERVRLGKKAGSDFNTARRIYYHSWATQRSLLWSHCKQVAGITVRISLLRRNEYFCLL